MTASRHKMLQVLERRKRVAELYLRGWKQQEIAAMLQQGQSTISVDLKCIRQQWKESSIRDFDEARQIELEKLALLEREAWEAWERSQKPSQEAQYKEGQSDQATKRVRSQHGDAK